MLPLCSSPPCAVRARLHSPRWPTNMGKIIRGPEAWSQVKLSTRRVGGGGACSEEFAAYLTCLDKTQANEEECKTLREALRRCMYVASSGARTSRHVVPINYHLQKVRRRIPPSVAPPRPPSLHRAADRPASQFIKGFKR